MKYLKYLQTTNDFESFKNSEDFILPNVSYIVETEDVSFEPYVPKDMRDDYLTIEALEDGLTASLSGNTCEYCVDGDGNWKSLSANTKTETINAGHTLSFRGELKPSYGGIGAFTINKKCNLKGNCMSMLFGDNAADNYSLKGMDRAFYGLFQYCTNIVNVSKNFLPATILAPYCYDQMFYSCSSLTTAPELPATTLAYGCYRIMFASCSKLNYIKMLATDVSASNCLESWVQNVASSGTFVKNPAMSTLPIATYNNLYAGIPIGWAVANDREEIIMNIDNYLTIEALEDGLTAKLSLNACEYCVDGDGNWKSLSANTATESINAGQTLSFRSLIQPSSSNGIGTFTISKKCNLLGNCMSMLFGDYTTNNYSRSLSAKNGAFSKLFYNCSNIISVSRNFLPATTLTNSSYSSMFYGCTSLVNTPDLSATVLEDNCYDSMFSRCTSLTTAPELPATTLAKKCCLSMFYGCTSLVNAPELPATTLADYCYSNMFSGCTSLTTTPSILPATTLKERCYFNMFNGCTNLTTTPELPATAVHIYCYASMFKGCTSLTTAPALPATTLAQYCYLEMFRDCINLTTAPELPATTLVSQCYWYMFSGCTNLTTAPELPATTIADNCYSGMFSNCTNLTTAPSILPATTLYSECYSKMFEYCINLTTAPELPATTLTGYCYFVMFNGCKKLNYIKMLATEASETYCLEGWLSGVSTTGTFVKNPAMASLPTGASGIPYGWTVQDAV